MGRGGGNKQITRKLGPHVKHWRKKDLGMIRGKRLLDWPEKTWKSRGTLQKSGESTRGKRGLRSCQIRKGRFPTHGIRIRPAVEGLVCTRKIAPL